MTVQPTTTTRAGGPGTVTLDFKMIIIIVNIYIVNYYYYQACSHIIIAVIINVHTLGGKQLYQGYIHGYCLCSY